ncbi:MAG: hypothetical protein AAFW95_02740 [Cyanobacteria bacterium J06638_6]
MPTYNDDLALTNGAANVTMALSNTSGTATFGGNGPDGEIILRDGNGQNRAFIDANSQRLELRNSSGQIISMIGGSANMRVGTNGLPGNAYFYPSSATDIFNNGQATVSIDGNNGNILAGGQGTDGDIVLRSTTNQNRIRLDAQGGNLWMGGNGADGDIVLFADSGDNVTLDQATIHLNGQSGDIILQNADCAEDFEVDTLEAVEPGTVMAISDGVRLRVSDRAYDHRVAGIVAGAGHYRPGIILGRKPGGTNQLPIALMGRVCCKVDADQGAIQVGDLLTTASTPGHAMKATDPTRAFGTVIGKALESLEQGQGLITVLVTLQ